MPDKALASTIAGEKESSSWHDDIQNKKDPALKSGER